MLLRKPDLLTAYMVHEGSAFGRQRQACCFQVRCEWGLSPYQESLITSVVFLGTMTGAYAWGALADARGRRSGFFGTAIFTCLFGLLSAAAPSYGVCAWLRLATFHPWTGFIVCV